MKMFAGMALALAASSASAQTSQCQWVGTVWTCQQQPQSGIDWGLLQRNEPYDYSAQMMDSFRQGQEMRQRELQMQQQAAEAARAQAEFQFKAQCRTEMKSALDAKDYEKAKLIAEIC